MEIYNRQTLLDYLNKGHRVKYLFFWGHQQKGSEVTKTCFSQWYPADFTLGETNYPTAEHFMMAEKARLFGDEAMLAKIKAASHPGEAKQLGRQITSFSQETWNSHKFEMVVKGNLAKFSQNPSLKQFLLNTGQRILVEASPIDPIWGIGLAAEDRAATVPQNWQGENLLGFALMKVRDQLRK